MKTLSADRCTVRCRVLKFDGAWKPLPFQVVDAPRAGNLCITDRRITCTAQSGTAPCAFVAPPLAFHTRVMIMFVDMIDSKSDIPRFLSSGVEAPRHFHCGGS